jgi:hypothetical protein
MFLGIDVGGANAKIATSDGFVDSLYAPLWQNKARLYDVLPGVNKRFGAGIEAVGAVMTGELSDCFDTRREGVLHIKHALATTFEAPLLFFEKHCTFRDGSAVDRDPLSFAATNWLASATFIAEQYHDAIFVDFGSTTTDVIPIVNGEIRARKTDLERLKAGELIYSGILRTNIATLLDTVEMGNSEACGVSSELFAITADAYLVLGTITEADYSCSSPNSYAFAGREVAEKSRVSALQRLARVVCSDLDELGEEGAVAIAEQVKRAQVKALQASLRRMKAKYGLEAVVAAGIGDFIVQEAVDSVNMQFLSLSSSYGEKIAATFPAYAVAMLLEKELKGKAFLK